MPEELIAPTNTFRDHQHGTWFVQSLVEVFMTHAHDTELVGLPLLTVLFALVYLITKHSGGFVEDDQ